MDALSAILTLKALDGLSARSIATAENIANASTPNYRPARIAFEEALVSAAARGDRSVQSVKPHLLRESAAAPGGELRLDLELATASSTAMRYAALIEVLGRQMQINALAVSGGR